jgi:hypothetical protein
MSKSVIRGDSGLQQGRLSAKLGALTGLTLLRINGVGGTIPTEIGFLTGLTSMYS